MNVKHAKTLTNRSTLFPKRYKMTINISSDSNLEQLRSEHKSLISEKIQLTKADKLKTIENKDKDTEINTLNERLHKLMMRGYDLDLAIKKENEIRNKCDIDKVRMANYCNEIKRKFENFDKTILSYEKTIANMKVENENLAIEYDNIIEEMEKTNNKIIKRIDNRIDVYNSQKEEVANWEKKVADIMGEIEIQKLNFSDKMKVHKSKYDDLQKKYNQLQKKVYDLQVELEIKKAEQAESYKRDNIDEKEQYEKTLNQLDNDNQNLQNKIQEVNSQYRTLTESNYEDIIDRRFKKKGNVGMFDTINSMGSSIMKTRTMRSNKKVGFK